MWLWLSFMVLTAVSAVITTLQAILTVLFRWRRRFFAPGLHKQAVSSFPPAGSMPLVSILKPVCGLEDELEQNLASFARLRGIRYEMLLSVADRGDPALAVIGRVQEQFPDAPFRVVVGGDPRLERSNRKVARLIAAQAHARGDIVFISDANVRVEPEDIARTIASFDDPSVGCVSNLFTGAGAASLGATIESLHLLSFVVTGNVLAAGVRVPCVVGKSMAIRRDVLQAIGGFEAFSGVLAEDQAIGLAVRRAGHRVALSPVVVRNVVTRRTIRRALDRQIRWNKIRFAFSPLMYSAEFLLHPLVFSTLATPRCWWLPLAVIGLRMLQVAVVATATGAPMRLHHVMLTPVLDVLQFASQFVPYYDDRVTWRGYSARIGPATALVDVRAAAA